MCQEVHEPEASTSQKLTDCNADLVACLQLDGVFSDSVATELASSKKSCAYLLLPGTSESSCAQSRAFHACSISKLRWCSRRNSWNLGTFRYEVSHQQRVSLLATPPCLPYAATVGPRCPVPGSDHRCLTLRQRLRLVPLIRPLRREMSDAAELLRAPCWPS